MSFHWEYKIAIWGLGCWTIILSVVIIHDVFIVVVLCIRCKRIKFLARKAIAMIRLHICRHSTCWCARCGRALVYVIQHTPNVTHTNVKKCLFLIIKILGRRLTYEYRPSNNVSFFPFLWLFMVIYAGKYLHSTHCALCPFHSFLM